MFLQNQISLLSLHLQKGGLAQLARAFDWQSKGHRFDSGNLHLKIKALQNIVRLF